MSLIALSSMTIHFVLSYIELHRMTTTTAVSFKSKIVQEILDKLC